MNRPGISAMLAEMTVRDLFEWYFQVLDELGESPRLAKPAKVASTAEQEIAYFKANFGV